MTIDQTMSDPHAILLATHMAPEIVKDPQFVISAYDRFTSLLDNLEGQIIEHAEAHTIEKIASECFIGLRESYGMLQSAANTVKEGTPKYDPFTLAKHIVFLEQTVKKLQATISPEE